ncbi:MAG TPA: hypothetical protein VJ909_07685 [Prolixibacteraceae bacterium]|nr:hypothetical protein [Prolixibacteraceae bacterium]
MSIKHLNLITLAVLTLFLAAACNNSSKSKKGTTSDGKEKTVEVEVFDANELKEQIVEIIQDAPDPKETANLLNEAGASYILDLTVPADDVDKFMTTTQKSIGLGMYAFDIQYATAYNRGDVASRTAMIERDLIEDLGLEQDLSSSEQFIERLKDNANNKDSVENLVAEAMNYANRQLAQGDRPDVYALAFIGANVEALYILSQLTKMSVENKDLLKIMSGQKERAKSIFSMLELMSGDKTVKPYYEKMKPVYEYYIDVKSFNEEQLNEIAPMIENLRNSIM